MSKTHFVRIHQKKNKVMRNLSVKASTSKQNYRENRFYDDSLDKQQKIMRKLSKQGI